MLKTLVACFVFTLSFSAYANSLNMQIAAKWQHKNVTKSGKGLVKAKLGHEFEFNLPEETLKMQLKTSEQADESILLEAKVFKVESGQQKLIASPKVITKLGEEAMISTENEKGELLELKVLPQRLNLL